MNDVLMTLNGARVILQLKKKDFNTGSKEYIANGKFRDKDNVRYQVNVNVIEIKSKPKKE